MTRLLNLNLEDPDVIFKTNTVLKKGGLVVVPTDTVYGLSVDAKNTQAVTKLLNFKDRPRGKAISVFVNNIETATKYVSFTKGNKEIVDKLVPGPYTFILPSLHQVDRRLESETGTLGIRIPEYPFILKMVNSIGRPVTATSANLSTSSPHYSVQSFLNSLSSKKRAMLDLIVDGGKLPRNKPSTVVDLSSDQVSVLRRGDIDFSTAENYLSKSTAETKKIGKMIIENRIDILENKPIVILLQGELGSGKTQVVKGIGSKLGIKNIISPTFAVYYEYKIVRKGLGYLYHVDLYNVAEREEFRPLGLEKLLKPGNVIAIEWGEKSSQIIDALKRNAIIIYLTIDYINRSVRRITQGASVNINRIS